jgi:hypothetical protein
MVIHDVDDWRVPQLFWNLQVYRISTLQQLITQLSHVKNVDLQL